MYANLYAISICLKTRRTNAYPVKKIVGARDLYSGRSRGVGADTNLKIQENFENSLPRSQLCAKVCNVRLPLSLSYANPKWDKILKSISSKEKKNKVVRQQFARTQKRAFVPNLLFWLDTGYPVLLPYIR